MAVVILFVVSAACVPARPADDAVDVNVAPLGTAPKIETVAATDERCTLHLVTGDIQKSSPGCYLDSKIATLPGVLRYPCSGTGSAVADFGEDHYSGRLDAGHLTLERTTELDWDDNCRWGTHAALEGSLPKGKPREAVHVAWSYVDHVISGSNCTGVCQAHANVEASTEAPAAKRERVDDVD